MENLDSRVNLYYTLLLETQSKQFFERLQILKELSGNQVLCILWI